MVIARVVSLCLFSLLVLATVPARAGTPSSECREGAAHCKEAFDALEKCQQSKGATPESCASEKVATEGACKRTTSTCHKDGSRRPPGK